MIKMTISGKTTEEIGEHYGISTKTVNSNRYRTFEKLGVKNDTQLTLMALRYGLIDKDGKIQSPERKKKPLKNKKNRPQAGRSNGYLQAGR